VKPLYGRLASIALAGAASASFAATTSPCKGVDRSLTESQRRAYRPAIERHLNAQLAAGLGEAISLTPADLFQQFRVGSWHIVYVNTTISDEAFLFYDGRPDRRPAYLADWAGAATFDEGPEIIAWLRKNLPALPHKLAACFAWHVTQARDQ